VKKVVGYRVKIEFLSSQLDVKTHAYAWLCHDARSCATVSLRASAALQTKKEASRLLWMWRRRCQQTYKPGTRAFLVRVLHPVKGMSRT
jgi:hypothetical protein